MGDEERNRQMARSLLESGVPVAEVNEEARKEKNAVPPITKLHYYFTRKPLIMSRLAIAAALLPPMRLKDSSKFLELLGVGRTNRERAYRRMPSALLKAVRKAIGTDFAMLDPFAGAGMIPFEALRMGLNVVALDYNPVACLVMRGTLEYPLRYGHRMNIRSGVSQLIADVEKYANEVYKDLREQLTQFYPSYRRRKPRVYIHAWAVKCPHCKRIVPLMQRWDLDRPRGIVLAQRTEGEQLTFRVETGPTPVRGNCRGGKARCIYEDCGTEIPNEYVVTDISQNEREMLVAIYLENGEFVTPRKEDYDALARAKKFLEQNMDTLSPYIPTEEMTHEIPARKYLLYWHRLFNARQLVVLALMARKIRQIVDRVSQEDPDYAVVIGTYLSMVFSKHLMRNNRATIWDSGFRKIAHPFSTRRVSMMWNHCEVNPFAKTAGALSNSIANVLSGLEYAVEALCGPNGSFEQQDVAGDVTVINQSILSWETSRKFDLIVTDPPYYNDVQYPELLQFYQVWYSRILGHVLDIPPVPETSEELSVGSSKRTNRSTAEFESRMNVAIHQLHNLLKDDGLLVMFYVHKSVAGWKYVVEALRNAGFQVTSTHTLRTESGTGPIVIDKSAVFHSLLITARKRHSDQTIDVLKLEEAIREKLLRRFPSLIETYGEDRTSLLVAATGVVLEVITGYSEIRSFTKRTSDYALEIGQRYVIELFAKYGLNIHQADPRTMLYLWFRYAGRSEFPSAELNQVLRVLGVEEWVISDLIDRTTDKRSTVRLLDFTERGPFENSGAESLRPQSLIDAVHAVLREYVRNGIVAAENLIQVLPHPQESILKTIESLAKMSRTTTGYDEGTICARFVHQWAAIHNIRTYPVDGFIQSALDDDIENWDQTEDSIDGCQ